MSSIAAKMSSKNVDDEKYDFVENFRDPREQTMFVDVECTKINLLSYNNVVKS